jgi:hypothetical protein
MLHRTKMTRLWTTLFCTLLLCGYGSPSPAEDAWGGIRLFEAELAAANQTTVTQSDGAGLAKIKFDIPTMTISWEVDYRGLTSAPTGIHLHGPAQPGTNAVAIIDLGVNGLESPISGATKVSDAHAQYMLLGWSYVLLKTRQYPEGEIRGKLDTVPPPDFVRDLATGKGYWSSSDKAAAEQQGEQ